MKYECHVTLADDPAKHAEWEALAKVHHWKTSYIVGDPLLGKGGFFYFTTHDDIYQRIHGRMKAIAQILGYPPVIREKIEQIIYDTKTSLVPCCPVGVRFAEETGGHPDDHPTECEPK